MRTALFIACLFLSLNIYAQEFIIKETGDTLFGEVKVRQSGGYKISVKPAGELEFLEFKGKEVKAYQTGKKGLLEKETIYFYYVGKEVTGNGAPHVKFLEPIIVDSPINLFVEWKSSYNYALKTTYEVPLFYIEKKDKTVLIKANDYKKMLPGIMRGCDEVLAKIGQKGYKYEDLSTIVDEYNAFCGKK